MRRLEPGDILSLEEYERGRDTYRRRIIELKKSRRVDVGRYLSFVFENRDTVWFQVQEMCRAERVVDPTRVAEEVEVYNALLPAAGELAATMFIEIADSDQIKPVLDKLLGIDARDYVRLEVGRHAVAGVFEHGHSDEDRGKISAVHFVRFPLPPAARQDFLAAAVALVVEHPNERARTVLSEPTKRALVEDLP